MFKPHAASACAAVIAMLSAGCGPAGRGPKPEELGTAAAGLSAATGSLLNGRSNLTTTALADGKVLAVGGLGKIAWATYGALETAELYDPATGTFSSTGSMTVGRASHTATLLANGKVLVVGGASVSAELASAEIYDPATGYWTLTGSLATARYQHAATRLADGRVLVTGGRNAGAASLATCEIYDPATGLWTPTAPLASSRRIHTATLFEGGKVLVVGGLSPANDIAYAAEIYDPAAGTWTMTGNYPTGRFAHRAFALNDGKVIIAGGKNAVDAPLTSVQIYQPAIDQWGNVGPLGTARSDFEGAVLSDGRVIVAGGYWTSEIGNVEIFDPSTVGWTVRPPLIQPRSSFGLAMLQDGRLLVAGGTPGYLASAEIYDPVCTPTTCAALGKDCGTVSDGCGGTLDCGTCGPGQVCTSNVCCTPTTCGALGKDCGTVSDGCGGTLTCGTCGTGQVCASNLCCTPTTCGALGKNCGTIPDGCGGTLTCGACGSGQTCVSNVCAASPGAAAYDATLRAPRCIGPGTFCDSGTLLNGRGTKGPEANAPNTINGSCADGTSGTYHVDESLDRLKVVAVDGGSLTAGKQARIEATVWAYSAYASDKLDLYYAADATNPAWVFIGTLTPAAAGAQTLTATYALPAGGVQAVRGTFRYGGSADACTTGGYDDHDDIVFAVVTPVDTSPPSTSITAPAAGAQLAGTVTVTASASDDVGVTRVEFYDGAALVGTSFASPYTTSWNTTAAANGTHTLTSKAYDASGKSATSAPVVVTVSNTASGIVTATYSAARRVPTCSALGSGCDSGTLLNGRGPVGPEPNAPNTINGSCADGSTGAYHSDESLDRLKVVTQDGTSLAPGKTVRIDATVWAYSTSDKLDLYYASDASNPSWVFIATLTPSASGAQTLSATYVLPAGAVQALRGNFRYLGSAAPCTTGNYDDHDDLVFVTQ